MTAAAAEGFGLELLAFGPHPDDVELFCGGLLAKLAQLGQRTGIVDVTRGERASRGTPETRAAEAEAASRMLGLTVRENLGLPDGWVHPWAGFDAPDAERARSAPVARVVEVLRRLRPELVLVPYGRERHPDHEAVSALVTRALFFAGVKGFEAEPAAPAFRPRQVFYYPMRHLAEPTFVVDVSGAHERKLAAIRCYASQVAVSASTTAPAEGGLQTLVGSPLSLSSLEARDRFYGAHIGVAHGEPYVTTQTLGLADPLEHFRRNAFEGALFFPDR